MNKQTTLTDVYLENEETHKPQLTLISNIPDRITDGKDELNFAEFPLSAISDRVDPSIKTLVFKDQIFDKSKNKQISREVMITGSDAYGLPTSTDEEVLLALIQLSKIQGFKSKRVYFNRHQLLKILGWKDAGQNYQRLSTALNRWMGVTLYYKNAWRDKEEAKWEDRSFHMLEQVSIKDAKERVASREAETVSYYEWNEVVFRSFQYGNVKSLNYEFLKALKSSVTQRLYRFLDKRFYHSSTVEFELKNLCYEHIGLSRKFETGGLKRKLNFAIDELEENNYLEKTPPELRFYKLSQGNWKVVFRKKTTQKIAIETTEPKTLQDKLINFGLKQKKIELLFSTFPESLIEEKLEIASWLKNNNDSRVSQNPAGFLVASIENDYVSPKEFVEAKKEVVQKEILQKVVAQKQAEVQERQVLEEKKHIDTKSKVETFLASLSEEERQAVIEEAISRADIGQKKMLGIGGKVGEATKQNLVSKLVLELVG
jgi:hypothetical protein